MDFGSKQRYENIRQADHDELVEQLNAIAKAKGSGENYDSSSPSDVVDAAIEAGLIDLQQLEKDYVERHPEIDPDNPNQPKGLDTRPLDEVSTLELYSASFDDQLADEIGADSESPADVVTQVEWALNKQYAEEKQFAKDTIEDRTDVDDVDKLTDPEIQEKFADEVAKMDLGLDGSPLPLETIAAHKKGTAIANLVEKGWDREDLDDLPPGDVVVMDRLNYPPPQNPTAEAAGEADSIADLIPRGEAVPADSKPTDGADGTEPTGTTNSGSSGGTSTSGGPTAVGENTASGAGPTQAGGASSASSGTVPDSASTAGGGSTSANDAAGGSGNTSTQNSQPRDSQDNGETVDIVFSFQVLDGGDIHRSDDGRWFDAAGNQITDPQRLAVLDSDYNESLAVAQDLELLPPSGRVDTLDTTGKSHEEAMAEQEQASASSEDLADGETNDEDEDEDGDDDDDDGEGDGTGDAAESEAETGDEEQEGQSDEKSESETEAGTPTPDGAIAIDPEDQARFDDSPFGAEQQQDQIDAIDAQAGVVGGPNDDPSGIDEEAFFGSPVGIEAAETRADGIERKVDGGDTDPADIDAEESGGGPTIDLKVEGGGVTDPVEDEGSPVPSDFGEGAKGDPTGGVPTVPGGVALTGKTDGFGEPDGPDDPTDPEGSLITANLGGPTAESAETFRGQDDLDLNAVEVQQVDDVDVAIELAE